MKHVDPASAEFERLPRQKQAWIYRHQFGWTTRALTEEFGVSADTIIMWTTPGAKERKKARKAAYLATDHGKQKRREAVRRYRANLKAKEQQEAA